MLADLARMEDVLRQSELDWTVIYASPLTNGPATGSVEVLPEGTKRRITERISRADVAAWLVLAATSPEPSRRSVGITGGTRTKEDLQLGGGQK